MSSRLSERYAFDRERSYDTVVQQRHPGPDGRPNAFGAVVVEKFNSDYPSIILETIPVICMHGGSAWLCRSCAEQIKFISERSALGERPEQPEAKGDADVAKP
jgi:hypothetical protein